MSRNQVVLVALPGLEPGLFALRGPTYRASTTLQGFVYARKKRSKQHGYMHIPTFTPLHCFALVGTTLSALKSPQRPQHFDRSDA